MPISPESQFGSGPPAERPRPTERLLARIETGSRRAIDGFFTGVTKVRCLAPKTLPLFDWEREYFKENPKVGDPQKRKTWVELRGKGVTSWDMYLTNLQNKLVIPEKLVEQFAGQATTIDNSLAWYHFDSEIKHVLGNWARDRWATNIFNGVSKGVLSSIAHNPDGAPGLIAAGGLASYMKNEAAARQGDIGNHLARMALEFGILLKVHYATHQRSLAQFRELPPDQLDAVSERIFTGSRLRIESLDAKSQAKAVAAGVGLAQTAEALQSESLLKAVVNLAVPAVASIGVGYKLWRETGAKAAQDYRDEQAALYDEADAISRDTLSRQGRDISVDLDQTQLPKRRASLVGRIRRNSKKKNGTLEAAPWIIMGSATAADELSDEVLSDAAPLVSSLILVGALSPLREEFTRHRSAAVQEDEIKRLAMLADAIDTAPYHIPAIREIIVARRGFEVIDVREKALLEMEGPLTLHQIDAGTKREVRVDQPIILQPGISLVQGISGTGKSELLRIIALEQGNVANTRITKGTIDLKQIEVPLLSGLVHLVEAVPRESELTAGEQLIPFITDQDDNHFKQTMQAKARQIDVRESFVSSLAERSDLIDAWINNAYPAYEDTDEVVAAKKILTGAFYEHFKEMFLGKGVTNIAEFLKRKPGASKGTSTGEAKRWELLKALMKQRAVLLLDEPTANLDVSVPNPLRDEYVPNTSSYDLTLASIERYAIMYPDTVILIASNDPNLRRTLINRAESAEQPVKLDSVLYARSEGQIVYGVTEPEVVWHSEPLRSE